MYFILIILISILHEVEHLLNGQSKLLKRYLFVLITNKVLEDSMTTMQELVLSGDAETVEYQISREKERVQLEKEAENEYTFDLRFFIYFIS